MTHSRNPSEVPRKDPGTWNDVKIAPGQECDVDVKVSESYSGRDVSFPVHVKRGSAPGPTLFVTAAVHGDELNGTGAIRSLIGDPELELTSGTLILVPVVNVLGFETHSRYLPDRRDLNRCFPGSATGSQASRLARVVFEEIVGRCDYGIDLHTAAVRRTNFPNIRGDLSNSRVNELAVGFGCEILVNDAGPDGSFRRAACDSGCATITLEAGEVWKVEPSVVEFAQRGIKNVLRSFGMIPGEVRKPAFRSVVERMSWVRSNNAGFLQFHLAPGSTVQKGEPIATCTTLLGRDPMVIEAPCDGIILGMTTLPVTAPGEPVCSIAQLPKGTARLEKILDGIADTTLHARMVDDLTTNIHVVEAEDLTDLDSEPGNDL